jgi:hypothetical protein
LNALQIIQNSQRSQKEREYCFNTWFQKQNSVANLLEYSDIPDFDNILNNLQLLSKSRLFLFLYCSFKFLIQYLTKLTRDMPKQIMIDGKNLHLCNQIFWEQSAKIADFQFNITSLSQKEIIEKLYKIIYNIYTRIIPENGFTKFIRSMVHQFCTFESSRIAGIFADVKNTTDNIREYVFPVATEIAIENWDKSLMGIIDRIDHLTNDSYAVIEYKYGKPKYFESYKETQITHELAFYNMLVQGNPMYVKGDVLEYLPERLQGVKFYYGSMVFFQDLTTAFLFKIKQSHMNSVKNSIDKYWNALRNGYFPTRANDACYEWCGSYWDLCEFNPEWLEIEKAMN